MDRKQRRRVSQDRIEAARLANQEGVPHAEHTNLLARPA